MVAATVLAPLVVSPPAAADPGFTPGPSDWSPHMDFWPYNTFTYQVTPEMISGMSDSCQWLTSLPR